jgi:ribosomal protein S6--L-glutamate ligase
MQTWILTDRRCLEERMPRALTSCLAGQGSHRLRVVIADDGSQVSVLGPTQERSVWATLERADVVIARSRHPFALALLHEAESLGARAVITSAAIRRVRDKFRALLTLEELGLPIPETFIACRPEDVVRLRPRFPLLLKPLHEDDARAIRLVRTSRELIDVEWGEPAVLAQRYVDSGGVDIKLYVAGERIWAVRRRSPLAGGDGAPVQISVDAALARLARDCADALELPLLGIDVVRSADGPVIVDVNEFPNYAGIEEAPRVIGRLLLAYPQEQTAVFGVAHEL